MGGNAAAAHLDGRINAVMAFEKWKAGVKPSDYAHRAAGALARWRYGKVAEPDPGGPLREVYSIGSGPHQPGR
jgi:hypothetical protein